MLPTVRPIGIEEVRKVIEFTKQFEKDSEFVRVNVDHCTQAYENMIANGIAAILVLEMDGKLMGSFGFIKTPDIVTGKITMVEMFWFVAPESRGHGLRLFNAFEKLAKEYNVEQIAMIHMVDSQPERLEKLYKKRGYVLIEKHYMKYIGAEK